MKIGENIEPQKYAEYVNKECVNIKLVYFYLRIILKRYR